MELQEVRKLDNRREPITITIIKLSYVRGDAQIARKEIYCHKRSGWCLDPEDKGELGITISMIGHVQQSISSNTGARNPRWHIYAYMHKEQIAASLLSAEMLKYKKEKLEYAHNCIPDSALVKQ